MRQIAVITGTRAEYSYLKPLMQAIENHSKLTLLPIITGMHLLPKHGNTYQLVIDDFPQSIKIPMTLKGDTLRDMAVYLSTGIKNLAEVFSRHPPDIVVILGDRSESLAAALAALYLNIPIAHINGGDVTGTTIDESIRHAITKIAHIHLVHMKQNGKRVEKMGEDKKRIYVVGALTLDTILHTPLKSKSEIFTQCHLNPNKTTLLVVQHPITTIKDRGYSQLQELFQVLDHMKEQTVLIYPNCDAGGQKFVQLIERYKKKHYIHAFKNLSPEDYLSLLKSVDVLIGNSSSGIIEASSFKIPVINIGSRQQGRSRSQNIIDVEPNRRDLTKALNIALYDKEFLKKVKVCKNIFGEGKASQRIVKILENIPIDDQLIQKQITY